MRFIPALAALAICALSPSGPSAAADCPGNPDALGVSRTVEIDTTGGPGFGFQHYKTYDFLEKGEVVLTFDDGPVAHLTGEVLAALEAECVKATFFPIGKQAIGYPEVLREIAKAGHTIGGHTWLHKDLGRMARKGQLDEAKAEIEKGMSAIHLALGSQNSPFFRFPFLKDSPELLAYLAERNMAVFSTDIDSFDFKGGKPEKMIERVMKRLDDTGKGILLFHAIQQVTAKALPKLLRELKAKGYRVVHLTAKDALATLPAYDEEVGKDFKGGVADAGGRPLSSVVKTVGSDSTATQ
ncbi:MAG: polysaccharide deacetylase family protein [Hyphomicrobiaceae bacterium]